MKKPAFTMIELVFIIVILGILAAIAVPKMAASRDDAYAVALKNDFHTVTQAIAAHAISKSYKQGLSLNEVVVYNKDRWEQIPVTGVPNNVELAWGTKLTVTGQSLSANYQESCAIILYADGWLHFHIQPQDHTPGREGCNVLRAFFGGDLSKVHQEDVDLNARNVNF